MAQNFSLIDLIPEPDTFTDKDGKVYEVKSARDFGAKEIAKLTRLQKQIERASGDLADVTEDDLEAAEQAAAALDQAVDELFGTLVPELPADRRSQIPLNHRMSFLSWWQKQQPQPETDPNPPARLRSIRGRRSPSSSGSTGSIQSES